MRTGIFKTYSIEEIITSHWFFFNILYISPTPHFGQMATVPLSLFSLNLTCLDLDILFYWGCKFADVIVQSIYISTKHIYPSKITWILGKVVKLLFLLEFFSQYDSNALRNLVSFLKKANDYRHYECPCCDASRQSPNKMTVKLRAGSRLC